MSITGIDTAVHLVYALAMKIPAVLITRLNEMTAKLAQHPALLAIGSSALTPDVWRAFAVQRYLSAIIFEPLLETAITIAEGAKDEAVTQALRNNQRDELGKDEHGNVNPSMAHASWRRDFYDALGITDAMLNHAIASPSVKRYTDIIRSVIATDEYLVMAGALLALERFFPVEFLAMKKGRETVFPEVFVDHPSDDPAKRAWRSRARLYLDDHIVHDAASHYPELLAALAPHVETPASLERIIAGISATENAKSAFYDALGV